MNLLCMGKNTFRTGFGLLWCQVRFLPLAFHCLHQGVHIHTHMHRHIVYTHACTQLYAYMHTYMHACVHTHRIRFLVSLFLYQCNGCRLFHQEFANGHSESPTPWHPSIADSQFHPEAQLWLCLEFGHSENNVSCFALWKEMQNRPCHLASLK